MTSTRVSLLLKKSRTSLDRFVELSSIIQVKGHSIHEGQLMEYLEVCHYHLRKPVEATSPKGEDQAGWNAWVLMGISEMKNNTIIMTRKALGQKLIGCWLDIVKWAKAIVLNYSSNKFFDGFCTAMGIIYNMILLIDESLLETRDIYDLAVDLWKGTGSTAGVNIHTEVPLVVCLREGKIWQLDYLLERTGYDPMQAVLTVRDRMKHAIDPLKPERIFASVDLLAKLVSTEGHPLSTAVLRSNVPFTISSNLTRLLAHKEEPTMAPDAILNSIRFMAGYTSESAENVAKMLRCGLLYNILETASMLSIEDADETTTSCLKTLVTALRHSVVVTNVRIGFDNFFVRKHSVVNLLERTSRTFRSYWKTFEALLLEQSILAYLFKQGYAPERSACGNHPCQKSGERRNFMKCGGCGFMLYCSKRCQNQDWGRHRNYCKKIGKTYGEEYNHSMNRFPRRVASMQIRRYWPDIQSMAKKHNIPEDMLGVRVTFTNYPYKLGVFDYSIYLSDSNQLPNVLRQKSPYHTMVADEVYQRSTQGHRCVMLVVSHSPTGRQLPGLAYLEEDPAPNSAALDQVLEDLMIRDQTVLSHYLDERKNELNPRKREALSIAMSMAWTQLRTNPDTFWKTAQYRNVVDSVLKIYRDGLIE